MRADLRYCSSIYSGSWGIRSVHHYSSGDGSCIRSHGDQLTQTYFWLYGDGRFFVRHYGPGFSCMGASYVCYGVKSFSRSVFVLLTLLIAVPSAIKVFNWLTTLWRGNIRFTPAMLFAIAFVSTFISGGLTGVFLGNSTLDIHLHDTYFIIAHFHIVMGVSAFLGMFCGVYHWFPKMYGRYMNNTMAYIHFWVTFAGAYLIFWPMHYEGLAGMPRRYVEYQGWASFNQFGDLNRFISTLLWWYSPCS